MSIQNILFVFLGGGFGSVLRYLISKGLSPVFSTSVTATFLVNILGSFLIGLLIGLEIKNIISKQYLLLLVTGFCGGFTTFSAFAFEYHDMLKTGEYSQALIYIFASIVLGLLAVGTGFILSK